MRERKINKKHDTRHIETWESDNLNQEAEEKLVPHQSKLKDSIKWIAVFCLVAAIASSFFVTSSLDEGTAEEVVANRVSTSTSAGEQVILDESYENIEARDFEVSNAGPDGGEARMLIWDFNAEDLDEVSVLVDGVPVKEKIILTNNATAISIPVPSTITITGVHDNGGGISYAVKFPNNKTTYFNIVGVGQSNTYTVLPNL
ncbi:MULTISPECIES: hypothetical protein [Bacillus]|uniref:hypothetical protein n=1 Tax=Bacillus TaxID=1386 RepID=UPI0002DC84C4|nr:MULTISPECIES: hypothetical protein [Bacillus]